MTGVKRWKNKPSFMFLLVAAMLALLPLLAVLQYRWVGQVSQSERDRMQASLRAGVGRFRQDFDREITRIFLNLQPDESGTMEEAFNRYPHRFNRWQSAAPYPQLVKDVYWVDGGESAGARLSHFNAGAGRFEATGWPEEMASLRDRLKEEFSALAPKTRLAAEDILLSRLPPPAMPRTGLMIQAAHPPIADEIPALVIPIRRVEMPSGGGRIKVSGAPSFVIVKLDLDYIKNEFIPELARRYFSSGEGLDYNLAIVSSRDNNRIIYQSDPQSAVSPSSSDATASLLAMRPDELDSLLHEIIPSAKPLPQGENLEFRQMTLRVFSDTRRDKPAQAIVAGPAAGAWQVLLKHRAGSLEAVVAGARRRNLIMSFGILMILAASMVMIIISTHRAQRLARRQMEFVAGVSHELRTPLAVISSAAENLADGVIIDHKRVQQYGALIKSEGQRLTEMVEQVLELAGAESGRRTYDLRPVDAGELIENAIEACRSQITGGGFSIEKEISSRPVLIRADSRAITRAIQNLITNAIKYSGSSRWIKVKVEASGEETLITVEDRGIGIAPDELPHIFEPFHRGREVIAAQIHGNGLGLSLVKNIIDAHDGQVTVESLKGQGSSFTLSLKNLP
jgi:signal transduction histidine kinase